MNENYQMIEKRVNEIDSEDKMEMNEDKERDIFYSQFYIYNTLSEVTNEEVEISYNSNKSILYQSYYCTDEDRLLVLFLEFNTLEDELCITISYSRHNDISSDEYPDLVYYLEPVSITEKRDILPSILHRLLRCFEKMIIDEYKLKKTDYSNKKRR